MPWGLWILITQEQDCAIFVQILFVFWFICHSLLLFFPPLHCDKVAVYLMMDEWTEVAARGMFCFEGLDINYVRT